MQPPVIRNSPLSVLVALAGDDLNVAPLLPALRSHCTLVCTSSFQAVEAARYFEPDIVLIDLRLPDCSALVRDLSHAAGGRRLVFVAMLSAAGPVPAAAPGFRYCLSLPATASELEQLLWQVSRDVAARGAELPAPPDSSKIG